MSTLIPLSRLVESLHAGGKSYEEIESELAQDGFSRYEIRKVHVLVTSASRFRRALETFCSLSFPWWVVLAIVVIGAVSIAQMYLYASGVEAVKIVQQLVLPVATETEDAKAQLMRLSYGSDERFADVDYFTNTISTLQRQKAHFIAADLTNKTTTVYKDGAQVVSVPIVTSGRVGSWWETPAGIYSVQSKEESHYSRMGHVYQPYSMQFQGNFYIHGWPHYEDGTPVSSQFSGGCIRMTDESARKIYEASAVGIPIIVHAAKFASDKKSYVQKSQVAVAASHVLVADMKSGFVFYEKSAEEVTPIASVTKLITALVASEYINIDSTTSVPQSAIVFTSTPRLSAGQDVRVYDLFFPLLLESSNEAALTIANVTGSKYFTSLMNKKAQSLGMKSSKFADASGASAANTSTAEDLFALLRYLQFNRSFLLTITQDKVKANAYGDIQFQNVRNYNDFGNDPSFVGGKVGQTTAAQETGAFIFTETINGVERQVAYVVLNTSDRVKDVLALRKFVQDSFE